MSRIAAVMAATGTQGLAVTKALASAGYHVRALTRSPSSQTTINKLDGLDNVEAVAFNIDDIESVRGAFNGAELVYLVPIPSVNIYKARVNGRTVRSLEEPQLDEEAQGVRAADVAKEQGVKLVIQSSISITDESRYMDIEDLAHKLRIERHLKAIGQSAVYLGLGMFNENLMGPGVLSEDGDNVIFSFLHAVASDRPQLPEVSITHDLGRVVLFVLEHFEDLNLQYKKINVAGRLYSMNEMLANMRKVLGKDVILNSQADRQLIEENSEYDRLCTAFGDQDYSFMDPEAFPDPILANHGFKFQSFEDFLLENRQALGV